MKKIIILILIISIFLYVNKNSYIKDDESIRFRVIANSNSKNDVIMKEKVVNNLSKIIFKENTNKKLAKENILNNMNNIEKSIQKVFDDNNYSKTYNILYGYNEFPEKKYNGKIYKKGLYESLVIEIGEAKGNNYWCFLYPSLCMIDYNKPKSNKYKLKILDLFHNLF